MQDLFGGFEELFDTGVWVWVCVRVRHVFEIK